MVCADAGVPLAQGPPRPGSHTRVHSTTLSGTDSSARLQPSHAQRAHDAPCPRATSIPPDRDRPIRGSRARDDYSLARSEKGTTSNGSRPLRAGEIQLPGLTSDRPEPPPLEPGQSLMIPGSASMTSHTQAGAWAVPLVAKDEARGTCHGSPHEATPSMRRLALRFVSTRPRAPRTRRSAY